MKLEKRGRVRCQAHKKQTAPASGDAEADCQKGFVLRVIRPQRLKRRVVQTLALVAAVIAAVVANGAFAGWLSSDNVTCAIAEVRQVGETATANMSAVAAESREMIRLVNGTEGRSGVFEFLDDAVSDFRQSHDHRQDGNCADENQFGRDDKASFIVKQVQGDLLHVCGLSVLRE